jgi:hypothetical protein
MISVREISTCLIQLFLSNLQRFFKPSPSSNSTDKPPDFTMKSHGLWAHSRKGIEIPGRADGARCASMQVLQCVGERSADDHRSEGSEPDNVGS